MTDDRPPIDPSDEELVSAYLDGEATADERARVESDPALLAEVESFRAVASAIGGPVLPLDQHRRDRMIAAALDAAPDALPEPEVAEPEVDAAAVVPISRGRSRWLSRAPGLAAAAAILFLIGIGLVISAQNSGQDQSADTASEKTATGSAAEEGDAAESAVALSDERSSAASPPAAPVDSDLGDFTDEADLRAALGTQSFSARSSPEEPPAADRGGDDDATETAAGRCAGVVTTTDTALGDLLAVRTATIDGAPVLVFSHNEREAPERIVDTVVDRGSCQILFAQAR